MLRKIWCNRLDVLPLYGYRVFLVFRVPSAILSGRAPARRSGNRVGDHPPGRTHHTGRDQDIQNAA